MGPGRLSAEAAAELPDRLLDAAFLLFSEQGFADATMDQIAKRAGASTKTLYSRFANKSEILEAVVRRNVQRTVADHLRGFALRPDESEPREFLYKFGLQVGMANLSEETSGLTRVTFAEGNRYPILTRMYREVTGRAITAISGALRIWREQGKVDFVDDPDLLAAVCFAAMTDTQRIRAALGDPMSRAELQRYVSCAADVIMGSIEPKRPKRVRK